MARPARTRKRTFQAETRPVIKPQITLKIHCIHLPGATHQGREGLRLGIQKGQEVIEDVSAGTPEVTFEASLLWNDEGAERSEAAPRFTGPYAQGPADARFVYLSWGYRNEGAWEIVRRAKLPLAPIHREQAAEALKSGRAIEVLITMTDAKGCPICATLKPDSVTWKFL